MASPSLKNHPLCDEQTRLLADEVWGPVDGKAVKQRSFGKGVIYDGVSLGEVFSKLGLKPDVRVEDHPSLPCAVAHAKGMGIGKNGGIVFKHRGSPEREIYFLSNTSNQAVNFTASLRISGRQPWLWNTVAGTITKAEAFTQHEGRTRIPLQLAAGENIYVVFEEPIASEASGMKRSNAPELETLVAIEGPWIVRFDGQGAPAETIFPALIDWTKHNDATIRHYAGSAVYETKFTLGETPSRKKPLFLDLGEAAIMAAVTVNGREVGTLWCPPWKIDVGGFVHAGENSLQIRVVNTWHNRLVADAGKPENERLSHISQPYRVKPETPPATSGLLGPVRVLGEATADQPRRER
jgi:hypothetical protein